MWSTCSIETGHSRTHAPQVTQSQTDVVGHRVRHQRRRLGVAASAATSRSSFGPSAKTWSRRPMISSLGERSLPVFQAGQTSWQRPHSVHENASIVCFQVRSGTVPAPKRISSSGRRSAAARSARVGPVRPK